MAWSPFQSGEGSLVEATVPPPENCPIFVVDDEPATLKAVARFLRSKGYPVEEFAGGGDALEALSGKGVALLISDISMPGINGIELSRRALEQDPHLAIIIFTAVPDSTTAVESLRMGVADYLTKPVDIKALEAAVLKTLRGRAQSAYKWKLDRWLRNEVDRQTEELQRVTVSTLITLVRVMEAKDPYLRGDSERVANMAERVATQLELPADEVERIFEAGLLHDIGFIGTPTSIMHKTSGLTDEEFEEVRRHVVLGVEILEPLAHLGAAIEYVRYHHERLDGSGYPEGRKGADIPLGAAIVGLADAYCALTTQRAYRDAFSSEEALETLRASEGVWFERRLLDALESFVASL